VIKHLSSEHIAIAYYTRRFQKWRISWGPGAEYWIPGGKIGDRSPRKLLMHGCQWPI